jgi:diacylglycerol kinase (ATP)
MTNKSIVIIYNPISSAGNCKQTARKLASYIEQHGYKSSCLESRRTIEEYAKITNSIEQCFCLIVVGGDGTLRTLLPLLAKSKTPVYMIPGGNESLFAKVQGMKNDFSYLLSLLEKERFSKQFFGSIESKADNSTEPFFTMASMGLDSLTVKSIGKRKGAVNDLIYAWHGFWAFLKLKHPAISLTVDGREVIVKKKGYFIIANNSTYAKDLVLVPEASATKDSLQVAFLPNAGIKDEIIKGLCMLLKKPLNLPFEYYSGKDIVLSLNSNSFPIQVDGDYFKNRDLLKEESLRFFINEDELIILT